MQNVGKQTEDDMTDAPELTDEQIRDMLDKATDGPWCAPDATTLKVTLSGGTTRKIRGDAHDNTPLAFVSGFDRDEPEEGEANARLIAAAPVLARLALERGADFDRLRAERDAALADLKNSMRESDRRMDEIEKAMRLFERGFSNTAYEALASAFATMLRCPDAAPLGFGND